MLFRVKKNALKNILKIKGLKCKDQINPMRIGEEWPESIHPAFIIKPDECSYLLLNFSLDAETEGY